MDKQMWQRFDVTQERRGMRMRSFRTPEGICDRLRAVAFAELQARDGFRWAAATFDDAPQELRESWLHLAEEEDKHMRWLLERLEELGGRIDERAVPDSLWLSLSTADSPKDFAWRMMTAEERGMEAGIKLEVVLAPIDKKSADLFARIAEEEAEHIRLANQFFPEFLTGS